MNDPQPAPEVTLPCLALAMETERSFIIQWEQTECTFVINHWSLLNYNALWEFLNTSLALMYFSWRAQLSSLKITQCFVCSVGYQRDVYFSFAGMHVSEQTPSTFFSRIAYQVRTSSSTTCTDTCAHTCTHTHTRTPCAKDVCLYQRKQMLIKHNPENIGGIVHPELWPLLIRGSVTKVTIILTTN